MAPEWAGRRLPDARLVELIEKKIAEDSAPVRAEHD